MTLVVATVVVTAGEVLALLDPAMGDTVSELVWDATFKLPLIPVAAGVLIGHFWFPKGACVHCGKRPWAK